MSSGQVTALVWATFAALVLASWVARDVLPYKWYGWHADAAPLLLLLIVITGACVVARNGGRLWVIGVVVLGTVIVARDLLLMMWVFGSPRP